MPSVRKVTRENLALTITLIRVLGRLSAARRSRRIDIAKEYLHGSRSAVALISLRSVRVAPVTDSSAKV